MLSTNISVSYIYYNIYIRTNMNELLYLGNRDVADETDVAQAFQLNENAQAEAAIRAMMKPELMAITVKLPTAEPAIKLMLHELRKNGSEIYLVSDSSLHRSKGSIIQVENANKVMITTPGSKAVGSLIYLAPEIRGLTGDFAGNRTFMRATFDIAKLPEVMAAIYRKNVSFHAKPEYRGLLNEWEGDEVSSEASNELAA